MYTLRTHPIEMSWRTLAIALILLLLVTVMVMVALPLQPWEMPLPSAGPQWEALGQVFQ